MTSLRRPSRVRLSHVLVLGAAMVVAACAGDTPTSPQLDDNGALSPSAAFSSSARSDLEGDGFRVDEIDPSDKEYNGEDGPFEHVIRAPNGLELVFRFAGKIRAREEVAVTLRARSKGQAIEGVAEVDFGDDRGTRNFELSRTAELTHTYRQEGRYRIFAILTTEDGQHARGGFRIVIDEALRVALTGEVLGDAQPDEDTEILFTAAPMNDRARRKEIHGSLDIDWGDEQTTFVKNFDGRVARKHKYSEEGTYTVKLTLTTDEREFTNTFKVEVSKISGLDPHSIIYLHANIADWKETSRVTGVRITPGREVCIYHTMAGRWPAPSAHNVEGNQWVFAQINGQWYGSTMDYLHKGQVCTQIEPTFPHFLAPFPLSAWRPKHGELVGFAVSTHARSNVRTVNERSNIVLVRWP